MPENDESGRITTDLDMNWRRVWIWSAVISAPLAVLIAFGILGDPTARGPVAHSFQEYMIIWLGFAAMLTPMGVLAVFRMTFDPALEFAKRQKERQTESENSPVAAATKQILTWLAKSFGRTGNGTRG